MHSLLNNIFVNCNDYMFYYFTRIVGVSSIYYRKLYNYININNTYAVTKIIIDNEESSNIFLSPTINFNYLLEVKYNVNNKDYWIQYNSDNKIEQFLFPIYDDISSGAFKETDDNIILVSLDQENINNEDLLTIIQLDPSVVVSKYSNSISNLFNNVKSKPTFIDFLVSQVS